MMTDPFKGKVSKQQYPILYANVIYFYFEDSNIPLGDHAQVVLYEKDNNTHVKVYLEVEYTIYSYSKNSIAHIKLLLELQERYSDEGIFNWDDVDLVQTLLAVETAHRT